MITREEYLNALEIVDKYNRQLNVSDIVISTDRETVDDWLFNNRHKFRNNKVPNILRAYEWIINTESEVRNFTYMDEINKHSFLRCRNAGKGGWAEFEFVIIINLIVRKQENHKIWITYLLTATKPTWLTEMRSREPVFSMARTKVNKRANLIRRRGEHTALCVLPFDALY